MSANINTLNRLKEEINKGTDPFTPSAGNSLDVHTVAGLFKAYFRELKEPLCTFEFYDCFLASAAIPQYQECCARIRSVLQLLPASNYTLFRFLIEFLALVAQVNCLILFIYYLLSIYLFIYLSIYHNVPSPFIF
jgi:hypothetical protein